MQRYQVGRAIIELVTGDIVEQEVDAIVNAANEHLIRGSGVCGAIFHAAGSRELAQACRPLAPCPTGEARITPGFKLPARYVIHAVGPVYHPRNNEHAARLLANAYLNSIELAEAHGLRSLAFPSLSTGAFGYPLEQAAPVALTTVRARLAMTQSLHLVRFVLWDAKSLAAFVEAAHSLGLQPAPTQAATPAETNAHTPAATPTPAEPTAEAQPATAGPGPGAALASLTAAVEGLLVPSEQDAPLTPFQWPGPDELSAPALLAHLGLPADTAVATRSLEAFFAPLAAEQDWFDESQRATAARFAALRDQLGSLLSQVVVYRLGQRRITTLITGTDANGQTVGLQTTQVET